MKLVNNLTKTILLIITICVFTFLNYVTNHHPFSSTFSGISPRFFIFQIALLALLIGSISLILNKDKLGQLISTIGLTMMVTEAAKSIIVLMADSSFSKRMGANYNQYPLFYIILLIILLLQIVFININSKKESFTKPSSRGTWIGITVLLFLLSHLNFLLVYL